MAKLVKPWNDGGSLSATYNGSGDGEAIFSSDAYEGIDREMSVTFKGEGVEAERIVRQEGIRQRFVTSDGKVFRVSNGGRFGVLKGSIEPPAPIETYTRLTYIECNGKQYIDLGYIVKEDDVIEANFILTRVASADHFLFGTADTKNGLWYEVYSNTAYARFGDTSSTSVSSSSYKYSVKVQTIFKQF